MRIYKIGPGPSGEIETSGTRECWITGLDCPECGLWANAAFQYPTVECAKLTALDQGVSKYLVHKLERTTPMTVPEYESLKATLAPLLGRDRPVEPGTGFGPVTAYVRSDVFDFAWITSFTPFVRESVFEEIREAGFQIAGAHALLKFKRDPGEPLIELEVPPTAKLASSINYKLCDVCGRIETGRQKKIVNQLSFDESIPIQRVYEIPSLLVASESFAKFIRTKKYSGVRLAVQESG